MNNNFFNIVLFNPEIPQNTGNIGRMCASNECKLHLIKPLGFEISDKHIKRSAMDYWEHLEYEIYENWEDFKSKNNGGSKWLLTTKSSKSYWDAEFKPGDYLIFGSESAGVPQDLHAELKNTSITIPMSSNKARSLNLASSAQTVYYEAFRQNNVIANP